MYFMSFIQGMNKSSLFTTCIYLHECCWFSPGISVPDTNKTDCHIKLGEESLNNDGRMNKKNNYLSHQISEHKKDHSKWHF